ncbi:hypothetical protein Efla_005043 [Eimeria flavescens]
MPILLPAKKNCMLEIKIRLLHAASLSPAVRTPEADRPLRARRLHRLLLLHPAALSAIKNTWPLKNRSSRTDSCPGGPPRGPPATRSSSSSSNHIRISGSSSTLSSGNSNTSSSISSSISSSNSSNNCVGRNTTSAVAFAASTGAFTAAAAAATILSAAAAPILSAEAATILSAAAAASNSCSCTSSRIPTIGNSSCSSSIYTINSSSISSSIHTIHSIISISSGSSISSSRRRSVWSMGFPRVTIAVGALLLLRAALTVVRGRRALAGAGEVPEGFSLPWTAVAQAVAGCCICIVGLTRHLGGLRPIRQLCGKPMRWDALHERVGFRSIYTRIRYASPIIEKHAAAAAAAPPQQQHQSPREAEKKQQ